MKYYSVLKYSEAEHVIEKSRFITYTMPVKTEEEAIAFIAKIKKQNYNATHNVSAYVIGEKSDIKRYSDDGEPSGTAGMPALDTLLKKGITNICVVITRYFGGIKLGTGGLVKAYTESTKLGVEASQLIEFRELMKYKIVSSYDLFSKVQYKLQNSPVHIADIEYMENVSIQIYFEEEDKKIIEELIDLTASNIEIEELPNEYVVFLNDKILNL
ncbi:MAG: YigZ family protein [Proteocatella sp.]